MMDLAIGTSNTQSNDDEDDGGSDTIDSPPRPVRTSSPRQTLSSSPLMSSPSTPSRPNSPPHPTRPRRLSASDNFRKYGSIRPPLSVLQKEFCTTYRLWEEHDAILRRVELKPTANNVVMMRTGNQSDRNDWRRFKPRQGSADEDDTDEVAEWEEAFAHLRTLYSRHHNDYDYQEQQFSSLGDYQGSPKNEFLESLCAIDDGGNSNNLEEKLEEEVEGNTNDDTKISSCDEGEIDNGTEQQQTESEQQRKKRADVETLTKLFCPGSKLSGTIALLTHPSDAVTIHSEISLIIMEENTCDEMGKPKGYLARQKKGSDEQCVFIHVKYVPLKDAMANLDDVELFNEDITTSSVGSRPIPQSQPPLEPEEKITIQIEYTDSEKRYWGFWNPDKLCFVGTAHKLGEGNDTTNRGGLGNNTSTNNAIMGGLISGRAALSGTGSDGGDSGVDNNDAALTATSAPRKISTFSLSPCTNLHPHGRTQASMWNRFAMSHLVSMVGGDYFSVSGNVGLFGSAFNRNNAFSANEENIISEQEQRSFMDELASDDNHKFALHRARTEMLLLETLMKLTELGAILDFAELARKRNVAIRREKWRSRMRKITPKLPRKMKQRKKKKAAGSDDFDFSIDSVQKKKVQFYDHLAAISWDRLLEAASIQAQRTCASFRHRSSLLDSLTFQTDEYKYQVMCDLRANGLTLASSHSEWDRCIQMGRTVSLGWSWFERGSWGCFERSAVVGKRCVYILFQMHSKLSVCHEQLEKSFRGADARISIARLESLVGSIDKSEQDGSDEIVCGICQCDIDETDGDGEENCEQTCTVVNLPCSHSFHFNCIREWLHDHSKCPICRIDLNE